MATAARVVTVSCRGCGQPRELTARSSRRAGLCRHCLHPPRVNVNDTHRKFWLKHFADSELAEIASETFGHIVSAQVFTPHRVALLGSADQPKP